jgi:hypothetical protein
MKVLFGKHFEFVNGLMPSLAVAAVDDRPIGTDPFLLDGVDGIS